ncbi:hypothetical protein J6590_081501 [Homalodisca vitripennis]|nr:hypothetical protein J6590_081501 [Homalodisca vitripennis]
MNTGTSVAWVGASPVYSGDNLTISAAISAGTIIRGGNVTDKRAHSGVVLSPVMLIREIRQSMPFMIDARLSVGVWCFQSRFVFVCDIVVVADALSLWNNVGRPPAIYMYNGDTSTIGHASPAEPASRRETSIFGGGHTVCTTPGLTFCTGLKVELQRRKHSGSSRPCILIRATSGGDRKKVSEESPRRVAK